eukprot:2128039-Alexandrium_andersonii.AAC.1
MQLWPGFKHWRPRPAVEKHLPLRAACRQGYGIVQGPAGGSAIGTAGASAGQATRMRSPSRHRHSGPGGGPTAPA